MIDKERFTNLCGIRSRIANLLKLHFCIKCKRVVKSKQIREKTSVAAMVKRSIVRNILSAIAVAGFGFILLNLTFLFDYLFQTLLDKTIELFVSVDVNMAWNWFPALKHLMFVVIILLISWFILRSKLRVLYKAIYMTVPLAVVYVAIGMFFYRWPIIIYSLSGSFSIGLLYYFYRTKKPWLYYYTLVLVGLSLLIATLSGMQI